MNSWIIVIILAVLQGIAEFLPVSSSGHLALLSKLSNVRADEGEVFAIIMHAGSLMAIVVFYFKTLIGFLKKEQLHLLKMVILGTIPVVIAGFLVKYSGLTELLFGDMLSVAMGFLITASILRLTGRSKLRAAGDTELNDVTPRQALAAGFAQTIAIIPGVSRSGSTIAAGYLSGMKFETAATFSFLLALPAIAGAVLLEIISLHSKGFVSETFSVFQLAAAFVLSAVVSFASLSVLLKIIRKGKFAWFSWYLFFLGAAIMIWQIMELNNKGN